VTVSHGSLVGALDARAAFDCKRGLPGSGWCGNGRAPLQFHVSTFFQCSILRNRSDPIGTDRASFSWEVFKAALKAANEALFVYFFLTTTDEFVL